MANPKISIIIPSYRPVVEVAELELECLRSIRQHTQNDYELVYVRNEEYNPLIDCPVLAARNVRFVDMGEPVGYARAVNIGVAVSSGDYLFIVNNDIKILTPGWDQEMLDMYESKRASVTRFGLLSPEDRPGWLGVNLDSSWWSCVLISRAVWDKVGPLDDKLLNYRFHDQDWSIRCRKAGYHVARYGGVRVAHKESSTYKHMKVEEGPEREEMVRRYGVAHFFEWIQRERAAGNI